MAEGHRPIQQHRHLLETVLKRVHHHVEQVEPALEFRAVEARAPVEKDAQQKAQAVDPGARVLVVGKPPDGAGVACLTDEAQLSDDRVVRVLLVVHEGAALRDVRAVRHPGALAARLAQA